MRTAYHLMTEPYTYGRPTRTLFSDTYDTRILYNVPGTHARRPIRRDMQNLQYHFNFNFNFNDVDLRAPKS